MLDGASQRLVQWYFDNLLPEEGLRVLLAGDIKLDAADALLRISAVAVSTIEVAAKCFLLAVV